MYSLFTDVSQLSEKIICKVLLKLLLIVLDRLFYLKVVTGYSTQELKISRSGIYSETCILSGPHIKRIPPIEWTPA